MPAFMLKERPESRSQSTAERQDVLLYASGSPDPEFIRGQVLANTASILVTLGGTLYRQTPDISIEFEASDYALITVPYGKLQREAGSLRWGFDTTGGTVNIKAGLESIASYPAGAQGHEGAIGVNGDQVDGVDIVIPALKFNVSVRHPKAVITLAQAFALGDATGMTNNGIFFTKPAESFLFLGGTGSDGTDAEAEVHYQFAYSKNLQSKVIGGITVAEKKGWHVAWVEFKDGEVAGGKPIKPPKAIHIERVYESINFPSLFGFG